MALYTVSGGYYCLQRPLSCQAFATQSLPNTSGLIRMKKYRVRYWNCVPPPLLHCYFVEAEGDSSSDASCRKNKIYIYENPNVEFSKVLSILIKSYPILKISKYVYDKMLSFYLFKLEQNRTISDFQRHIDLKKKFVCYKNQNNKFNLI